MKLECIHVDTCLPCYWQGHHQTHVQIPVYKGMTLKEIKEALKDEIRFGEVMGSCYEAELLANEFTQVHEQDSANKLTKSVYAAINRLKPGRKGQRKFFTDLEEYDENSETVYAYFIFKDA